MSRMAIDPTPDQLRRLAAAADPGPIVMIDLLGFKPGGGAARYERYAEGAAPHLAAVGGRVLYLGAARQLVIGDGEQPWWDTVIVVEYPSIGAFMRMVSDPEYQAVSADRTASLSRAELIATAPGVLAGPSPA